MASRGSLAALLDELEARQTAADPPNVPERFTDFVEWLGVEFTRAQKVVALICYDGVEPRDLPDDLREIARAIFGEVETIPAICRKVIVLVCGRRGGKSYVLEALALVHAMYRVPFFKVAPGQIPVALVIAPNDDLRQEVVNYAIGAIRSHPQLRTTLIVHKGAGDDGQVSTFEIRRPRGCPNAGRRVAFRSGVATHGGYGGRGKSLVGFALDEAAFFRGDTNKVNDVEIFKGAIPGLMPGAKAIVPSTPWAQSGLLWDKWNDNWGHPKDAICAHAPTVLLRPEMAELVEEERAKDPEYAEREFDARFMSFGTTQFFSAALISSILTQEVFPLQSAPGCTVGAGVDLGFRSDSSAFSGTIRFWGRPGILLARLIERRPEPGVPLKPGEVVAGFVEEMRDLGCRYVMADGHYIESLREHARELPVIPAPGSPSDVYVDVRTLMRDGKTSLPNPALMVPGPARTAVDRLIQQLKEVQGRPIPGGGMSIILPKWRTGGHGDLCAAYVLSVAQVGGTPVEEGPMREGGAEWERRQLDERKRLAREKGSRPWRPGGT